MLRINGYPDVSLCANGVEVTQLLKGGVKFDLVLLDLQLRGDSGYQMLIWLRPALIGIPIIAVTAQVMPDEVTHAEQAGFDGFIGKPLDFDHFPGQIRRVLAGERVWEPR